MESISRIVFRMYRGTDRHGPWLVACLEGAWPKLLGEKIAAACAPVDWRDRTLAIEIRDDAWTDTLQSMREELLERIRRATGDEVCRLRFQPREPSSL